MNIELNTAGLLLNPNLHDGHVIGISLVEKNTAHIVVRDVRQRPFILETAGIRRFLCNGFAEGNIICAVIVVCRFKPPSALRRLLGEPHPSVGEPHRERHERWIAECARQVEKGELTFLEIAPSYGCEVLALCERLQVREGQ